MRQSFFKKGKENGRKELLATGKGQEVGNTHTFYLHAGEPGSQLFPSHWLQPEAPNFTSEFNSHVVVLDVDNLFSFPCPY